MVEELAAWVWQVHVRPDVLPKSHLKFRYHDSAVYEGRWEADLRHGQAGNSSCFRVSCQGLMQYPDGSAAWYLFWSVELPKAYNGNWVDDMRDGQAMGIIKTCTERGLQGQMSFGDGAQYSGGWLQDARHGYGSYRPSNVAKYST